MDRGNRLASRTVRATLTQEDALEFGYHDPVEDLNGEPCPKCEMGTLAASWTDERDRNRGATAVCNLCDARIDAHYHRARPGADAVVAFADTWRDRLYAWLCNRALVWIATDSYRHLVHGLVSYGMNASARDWTEGIDAPKHWTYYVFRGERGPDDA